MTPRNVRWLGLMGFCLASTLTSLFVFRDALWGQSLLAPLDIAPAAYPKYRFMDPSNPGVMANHYLNDQLMYDLPLQYTIYCAYARGELPWWDPHTFAGRPLLADAHVSGTDPVRVVVYHLLPFELAYNWTRVLHFFFSGLGLFLLLRHFGQRHTHGVILALTYAYAGCHTWFFGHPWIHASFLYYPYLWLVWDWGLQRRLGEPMILSSLLLAGIFYAGNLQSHSYVVMFALAFAAAALSVSPRDWKRVLFLIVTSGFLGALLAAPVLLGQLEFFANGVRSAVPTAKPAAWLSGLVTLTAVYPWMLGTFRTFDLRNLLWYSGSGLENGLGVLLFIGSAGFLLAVFGGRHKDERPEHERRRRTALCLVGVFLVVLSTPLIGVFYPRCAGLAGLGLVVLAGFGVARLSESAQPCKRWGWITVGLTISLAVGTNVASLVVYPRFVPRVQEMIQRRDASNPALGVGPVTRRLQVERLPDEVSFKNPETVLACGSLLLLGAVFILPGWRKSRLRLVLLLLINAAPVILYCQRFVPRQPIGLWQRFLAGGPEQQKVAATLGRNCLRLWDAAPARSDQLLPFALANLYSVNTVHGYSALMPRSLVGLKPAEQRALLPQLADYKYESLQRGLAAGQLTTNSTPGLARFQWQEPSSRTIEIQAASLNEIHVKLSPGPPAPLLWTDTHYPGWKARAGNQPLPLEFVPPCFTRIHVPGDARTLNLCYTPRFLRIGEGMAMCGLLGLSGLGLAALTQRCQARPDRSLAGRPTRVAEAERSVPD